MQHPSAFALKANPDGARLRDRWQSGIDVPADQGRADSGDIEIDLVELVELVELFTEVAELAADVGAGIALLIDEMQDVQPADFSALCAACHELSQSGAPLVVVGAGLPHLPAVLSASKSYSERLFRYVRIDRLARSDADHGVVAPIEREEAEISPAALDALFTISGGYLQDGEHLLDAVRGAVPEREVADRAVQRGGQRAAQPGLGAGLHLARAPAAPDRHRPQLAQQHRLADAAQPREHETAFRTAARDTFEPTSKASTSRSRPASSGGRCPAPGAKGLRTGSIPRTASSRLALIRYPARNRDGRVPANSVCIRSSRKIAIPIDTPESSRLATCNRHRRGFSGRAYPVGSPRRGRNFHLEIGGI